MAKTVVKRGPLSSTEKEYVIKNHEVKTTKQISKLIHRSESIIEKFLTDTFPKANESSNEPVVSQVPVSKIEIIKSFGTKTQGGKGGVIFATQSSSTIGDESTKQHSSTEVILPSKYRDCVFKTND